jgi:hypothetical protein
VLTRPLTRCRLRQNGSSPGKVTLIRATIASMRGFPGVDQHKYAPGLIARAERYVSACCFAAAAIDAPAHHDRPRTEQHERFIEGVRERMAAY